MTGLPPGSAPGPISNWMNNLRYLLEPEGRMFTFATIRKLLAEGPPEKLVYTQTIRPHLMGPIWWWEAYRAS